MSIAAQAQACLCGARDLLTWGGCHLRFALAATTRNHLPDVRRNNQPENLAARTLNIPP